MRLYINIDTKRDDVSKIQSEKFRLTINSIDELRQAVIDFCIQNYTWKTVLSFNVVARLDGRCDSVDKAFYQKQPLHIVTRKERYEFTKGSTKGVLVWSQDAIVF
jgi:hypothetical protein